MNIQVYMYTIVVVILLFTLDPNLSNTLDDNSPSTIEFYCQSFDIM